MTDEQKQNDRFWIANVASLDAYPEPVEIPPLEIYQALQDKRSSFRSGYLAGLNARSRPEPGGDDKLAERCNKFNDQVNQLKAELAELKARMRLTENGAKELWGLLDDISTLGDSMKPEQNSFFKRVSEIVSQRHGFYISDGYNLTPAFDRLTAKPDEGS